MENAPGALRVNGLVDPLGVDPMHRPTLTWRPGAVTGPLHFDLEITTASSGSSPSVTWRSESPLSGLSSELPAAIPWSPRSSYVWRVRHHQGDGVAPWSAQAVFEAGVSAADYTSAQWISAPDAGADDARTLYFRAEVELVAPVVRGRAYASGLGWYRIYVNHVDVTGQSLVPRWTPFDDYVEHQTYDVTRVFRAGPNVIGVTVADGRFRGALGVDASRARYGERIGVLAQVELELADGSQVTVGTGADWAVGLGRIRSADPMLGERVDLRISDDKWLTPGGLLEAQVPAEVLPPHGRTLVAEEVARLREVQRLPGTVRLSPSGVQIVDFGQNFAGVAAITLRGEAGRRVRLLYGEVLTSEGELDTDYLQPPHKEQRHDDWFQRDEVVLNGTATRYCPRFTIKGFRYVAVEGADTIEDDEVEGIVMTTDVPVVADFKVSDPQLEQLWQNALWSLRSNFLDTATDCPTRERSGWTGDLQVFGPTAVQLVESGTFLRRYLRNLAVEQLEDGRVPPVIPSERSRATDGPWPMEFASTSVGWGDVAVLLPWTLYKYLGDEQVLRDQYDSARKWVDQLIWRAAHTRGLARRFGRRVGRLEDYIVDTGFHWGEWLRAGEEGVNTWWKSKFTPPAVVATAYLAHSSATLSDIARVLGDDSAADHYAQVAELTRTAWRAAFVRRSGARIGEDKQDDYVRALAFDLLQPDQRRAAAERLVALVEAAGDHLGTGFLSTPMLLSTLVESGRADVAYRLLFQRTPPSWLGQVERGATTIWETWTGHDAQGRARESHNHYAFGSVARFLHEYVAGVRPAAPGFRQIRFAPALTDRLTSASLSLETPLGVVASSWRRSGTDVEIDVQVPVGAEGVVELAGHVYPVSSGSHHFSARVQESGRPLP